MKPADDLPAESTATPTPRVPPFLILEAFRGVAALWVVLFHATRGKAGTVGVALEQSPFYAIILRGQLGVAIFFVISGYCIAAAAVSSSRRERPILGFLRDRIRRIYPPYLFSVAFWVAISTAMGLMVGAGLTHRGPTDYFAFFRHGPLFYLSTATLTQFSFDQPLLQSVYWTLCYEVAFYAIVAISLAPIGRGRSWARALWALNALTIGVLAGRLVLDRQPAFPLGLFYQFGLGVLLYHVDSTPGRVAPKIALAIAAALTLAIGIVGGAESTLLNTSEQFQARFTLGFACLLLVIRGWDERIARWAPVRWLSVVGVFSYSLYLTHDAVVTAVARFGGRLGRGWPGDLVLLALQVIAALVVARLFFRWCEAPFLKKRTKPAVAIEGLPIPELATSPP